jgi:hypothetical protein
MYAPVRGIPYMGQKRLHMILGLFFGLVACTWAFSGMLSMEPFPLEGNDEPYGPRIAAALGGGRPALEAFAALPPQRALSGLRVKVLQFSSLLGEPVYIAKEAPQRFRVVPVRAAAAAFDWKRIVEAVRSKAPVAEARLLPEYDAYYLDRRRERPLPVVLVRLGDAENSRFYIDPRTARIVGSYSSGSWMSRWLYHGLHSLNLPWLYRYRPAWDIVVLMLLAGGAALSFTAMILAWQLLRRKFSIIFR